MDATIVLPTSIPDFVHPPVPGESHDFYGNTHLESIRFPPSTSLHDPGTLARSLGSQLTDPLGINNINNNYRTPHETGTQASTGIGSGHNLTSGAATVTDTDPTEGSSEDTAWARLVEACVHGRGEDVQEILRISPQLKESIDNISSATGMNPLHFAASRGHDGVVRILIDQAGAGVDVPDREGETALLKASYSGYFPVVCFLLKRGANVHQRDKDGWTALHNASSGGFIDVAQVLLEKGEADINARSKMGHTPLINAASKGNVALVLYFLNHARANPLLKNVFLEMAYDVAAANSEAYLCDILQSSEKQWWKSENTANQPYDPLTIHSTILLTVHENQRASGSFPLSFMTPKFSANALTQQDICGPWSLPNGRPSTKDDVHLPLVTASGATSSRTNMQRGWFWMTEWVVDKTDPNTDSEGWQYGKSLIETNQPWSAVVPTSGSNWVRRRKWVRVMKKRVDLITPGELPEGSETFVNEMAGNYMKRANLALRPDDGFADAAQELARYRQAIQILLSGIRADKDPSTILAASELVQEYLKHAEDLAESIQRQNATQGLVSQLETPRIALRSTEGSHGSGNELRRLTLQKSRPSDDETVGNAMQANNERHQDDTDDYSSIDGIASADNNLKAQQDILDHTDSLDIGNEYVAQASVALEDARPALSSQSESSSATSLPIDETQDLPVSLEETSLSADDASQNVDTDAELPPRCNMLADDSSTNIPIQIPNQEHSEVSVISPSPATAQADPFPMARLTRSSRPCTPTSSSASQSSPTQISNTVSSHAGNSSAASPMSAASPTSRYTADHGQATFSVGFSSSSPHASSTPTQTTTGFSGSPRQLSSSMVSANHHTSQDRAFSSRSPSVQSPQQPHAQHFHSPLPVTEAKWESDARATECRECHRKFSLWVRRHHCRRCGRVVCDRCSSHRATLHPSMVVYDPSSNEAYINHQALSRRGTLQSYRVCDTCFALGPVTARSLSAGSASGSSSGHMQSNSGQQLHYHRSYHGQTSTYSGAQSSSSPGQFDGSQGVYQSYSGFNPDLTSHSSSRSSSSSNLHPTPMVRNASSSSLMSECPVCGAILAGLEGGKAAQEAHVNDCLEGKPGQGSGPINNVRYVVYKLPADSPLVDQECAICFEEFVAGRTVARLNCLCTYHRHCIHTWLQHGKACPVHYR
ncbi:hypothetical protein BGZ51_009545 [Haplosporangium sp. Z 767]|nr:hypothetical protein BGZ50_007328 [Haplosporangium sp. Z 11]KAF9194465.1 hypothetical protein BGZ51_009545 [Haplosporangium sp. Z 767]